MDSYVIQRNCVLERLGGEMTNIEQRILETHPRQATLFLGMLAVGVPEEVVEEEMEK